VHAGSRFRLCVLTPVGFRLSRLLLLSQWGQGPGATWLALQPNRHAVVKPVNSRCNHNGNQCAFLRYAAAGVRSSTHCSKRGMCACCTRERVVLAYEWYSVVLALGRV
jgi:hypothetical protein